MLGLCLAGAREVKDTALKNLKDVRAYTQLPVLGSSSSCLRTIW